MINHLQIALMSSQETPMPITIAFDVYGTLIDTQGVIANLEQMIGGKAQDFSQTWREKQLEYSFRRGLMQNYVNFGVCTSQALNYTCQYYGIALAEEQKNELLSCYSTLPAFEDVSEGLKHLKEANSRLYAFSNGSASAVEGLLANAGIREFFDGVVSCDDLKTFKPNPAAYSHFLRESGSLGSEAWLVSSNPFDVIGAISSGMRAAWLQRSSANVFDPWDIEPTITINNLCELHGSLD
jgi:2-haloacid dehalogenase